MTLPRCAALLVLLGIAAASASAPVIQTLSAQPVLSYQRVEEWPQLPRDMQAKLTRCRGDDCEALVNAVVTGTDGSFWMLTRFDPPLIHVDAAGKLLKGFGAGLFVSTHGLCLDRAGDLWAGDTGVQAGSAAAGPKGLQVHKFTQDGEKRTSLGQAGEAGIGDHLFVGPVACVAAPNGDVLIADGHIPRSRIAEGDRIMRFSQEGRFLTVYGKTGSGPGEFKGIHGMAFDARGYLYVADRTNNRVQVFDPQMRFVTEYAQLGRPSGLTIVNGNMLVVSDWESGGAIGYSDLPGEAATPTGSGQLRNALFMRGQPKSQTFGANTNVVRVASALNGSVLTTFETMRAESLGTDRAGNIYVGPWKFAAVHHTPPR